MAFICDLVFVGVVLYTLLAVVVWVDVWLFCLCFVNCLIVPVCGFVFISLGVIVIRCVCYFVVICCGLLCSTGCFGFVVILYW